MLRRTSVSAASMIDGAFAGLENPCQNHIEAGFSYAGSKYLWTRDVEWPNG